MVSTILSSHSHHVSLSFYHLPPVILCISRRNTTAFHHYTFKHLQTVVAESQGYDYQLVILFVALCRALGIQTRYTCVLDPRHLRSAKTHVQYFSPSIEAVAAHVWGDGGRDSPEQKRSRRNASVAPRIWTELYCMGRWIHVDPIYYHVDTPYEVERARGRGRNVSYVISQEASGRILDVTRRYASSWSKTLRLRLAHPLIIWWETLLRDSSPASAAASIHEKEDVALEMNIQQQPPPTSIAGFKKHHIYCLERFIGKYECIYPRKAVGVFKGQPYFLRCAIQQLQTKHNWRKKGRRILDDEIDTPIKKLEMKDRDPLRLYGEWQTVIYKADPLIDGIVPLNEYGNMEVWSTADVPVNATHLKLPRISTIAKKLGLSYAPAVVGFEVKNGMNRPIFDGIIVATESVRMIEEANAMVQQQKLEKAIEHNQKLIYKRWARMIKGISLRTRLQHDYGPY